VAFAAERIRVQLPLQLKEYELCASVAEIIIALASVAEKIRALCLCS